MLFCFTFSLHSQSIIETDPILGTAFPMEDKGNTVLLSQTILLNKQILPAGSVLRVLYVLPQLGDNEVREEVIKKQQERVFSRAPEKVVKDESPIILAAKKLATETRWTSSQLFRLKLANQNTPDLKLVYQETPDGNLKEVPLNFLHGLFLGEKSGEIIVIAVERRSPSSYGGFQGGDTLLQIGSQKLDGNLSQFLKVYQEEKIKAEATASRDIVFQVQPANQGAPVTRSFKAALSLKSNLLEY